MESNTERRRHSEASAPQIIQHTTPTKLRKLVTQTNNTFTNDNTNTSNSFVILETPPKILSSKNHLQEPQQLNDLTGSVRRLFS